MPAGEECRDRQTHDFFLAVKDAFDLADRIAVMREGAIRQIGPPDDIYLQPADSFVAAFFGDVNRFHGTVSKARVDTPLGKVSTNGFAEGTEVEVLLRPEALELAAAAGDAFFPELEWGKWREVQRVDRDGREKNCDHPYSLVQLDRAIL